MKSVKWRLAIDLTARADNLESTVHAVERVASRGPGEPTQFIPMRFIYTEKLNRDDRLLLAFDALVLSETLGREVGLGKIVHGDASVTLEVKTGALTSQAQKLTETIDAMLRSDSPPDLALNRHCVECEFQSQCRQKAIEKRQLGRRHWEGKAEQQQATYANRRRIQGAYGKQLLSKRGELLERSFAHCYDTG